MTDPAEHSARSDPEAGRDDQPENAPPESPVIKLSDTGDDQAQYGGYAGFV